LLRTIAAFGSHDTVPIVKVGIGAWRLFPADMAERPLSGGQETAPADEARANPV